MHTIDELAQLSGMPSRTIRFYNTQGMLPLCIANWYFSYESNERSVDS
jgi:MerR family regulatory protein